MVLGMHKLSHVGSRPVIVKIISSADLVDRERWLIQRTDDIISSYVHGVWMDPPCAHLKRCSEDWEGSRTRIL